MSEEVGSIYIEVNKTDPKPNPVTYELSTVSEIFDAVTEENIERLLEAFEQCLRLGMATRALTEAISVGMPEGAGNLAMERFVWIDD